MALKIFDLLFGKKKTDEKADGEKKFKKIKKKGKVFATTVQEILDFDGITDDGILVQRDRYSKLYALIDSNFVTEPEDKQFDVLVNYTKFVNKFPDNVDISVIIVNKRNTKEELSKSYHLPEMGDDYDKLRKDYNAIIDAKIEDGHNDITKEKYIMLTVRAKDLTAARVEFSTSEVALQESIKAINKVGVKEVGTVERIRIMADILKGTKGIPFEKEFDRYIGKSVSSEGEPIKTLDTKAMKLSGVTIKDLVAPQVISKDKGQSLQLDDDRFCRSFAYQNLPQSIDTSFLTKSTNLPYEMVTVIQLKAVPKKQALRFVKNQNVSIKADVIKASQRAYQNGYDPSLMSEDLQLAQEQARKLRNDVVNEGKKLFFATMVVTVFGETPEELNQITSFFKSNCQDYSVTPSLLIGQQVKALNTSALCGNSKVIIDRLLTSDNTCGLFPFNIQELTDKNGHFYGSNAISKNMIMYDRKRSKLANGLVFGMSGSGKSFITKGEIIPNLLDGEDAMIILDPENEYRIIAQKFGGTVIDLETKSDYHLNPCDMSMEWGDTRANPLVEKCDYMVGIVESILGRNRECNAYEVNVIHRACNRMYEPYIEEMTRRHENGDDSDIDTEICPTLVDFYEQLVDDNTPEGNKIAMAIEPYCVGNYNLFAHKTNIKGTNRLTVFNLLYLPEKMKEMAMKVCLSNIWTRIVKNKEENEKNHTSKAVWVYLDEFHLFFQTESSATTIMAYFKRVRKYGGIMTGITQDVADLFKTQQGIAMFNNTGFFIVLNQGPVGRQQIQNLWQCSDALIDYIKDKPSGMGLIYNNTVIIPFDYKLPNTSELYKLMSTNPNDEANKKLIKATVEQEMARDRIEEGEAV